MALGKIDLSAGWIRETDFVRAGLVFYPPSQSGPRRCPDPDDPLCGASYAYLVDQEIRFLSPASGQGERPKAIGSARITSFDPETSKATIADIAGGASAAPGTLYEIEARTGMHALPSSRGGVLHTFVWDSHRDLLSSEEPLGLASSVKLRALAVDTESGNFSLDSRFDLESGFFAETQSFAVAVGGEQVAVGDVYRFKHELHRNDLVVLSTNILRREIQVFAQSASGTFSSLPEQTVVLPLPRPEELGWKVTPRSVAAGDVNGDGRSDVIVASAVTGEPFGMSVDETGIAIYLAAGAGISRDPSQSFRTEAKGIVALAIADVTGDGRRDLVAAASFPPSVSIHANEGGEIRSDPILILPLDLPPSSLAVGDIDGDGRADLAVAAAGVDVFLRREADSYERAKIVGPGDGACVAVAGLRERGGEGLLVADPRSGTVSVYSCDLALVGTIHTDGSPVAISPADIDFDGLWDVMVAGGSGTLDFHLRGADSVIPEKASVRIPLTASPRPGSIAVADLNSDGRDDVAVISVISSSAKIFEQVWGGSLPFRDPQVLRTGRDPKSAAIGDLDGDGRNDVVVADAGSGTLSIFCQTPSGDLPLNATHTIGTAGFGLDPLYIYPDIVAIGDVDGNGRNDVALARYGAGEIDVYAQMTEAGELSREPTWTISGSGNPRAVAIGDVTGDGRNEIVVASAGKSGLSVYSLAQNSACSLVAEFDLAGDANSVRIGDLNGDGKDDVVVTTSSPWAAYLYWQTGSAGLSASQGLILPFKLPSWVRVGDLNGDGRYVLRELKNGKKGPELA